MITICGYFLQIRESYSETNSQIWSVFDLLRDFVHVLVICKFEEDPFKIKYALLIYKHASCNKTKSLVYISDSVELLCLLFSDITNC